MKIYYDPHQFSDVKALMNLYWYTAGKSSKAILFKDSPVVNDHNSVSEEKLPIAETWRGNTLCISTYADFSNSLNSGGLTLQIDAKLLHNCGSVSSLEDKIKARKKLDIPDDMPIVVIGFVKGSNIGLLNHLLKKISELSRIYLFPSWGTLGTLPHNPNLMKHPNIEIIDTYGELENYFKCADIALYADTISPREGIMHNYIEATAGGLLYCVEPSRSRSQYGFKELLKGGSIVSCQSLDEVSNRIAVHLGCGTLEKDIEASQIPRDRHVKKTIDTYLPVLAKWINFISDAGNHAEIEGFPAADLKVYWRKDPLVVRLLHPVSRYKGVSDSIVP